MTPRTRMITRAVVLMVMAAGVMAAVSTSWPSDGLPIKLEAKFDGTNWKDITSAVDAQTIRITRGAPNESPRSVPANFAVELTDPDGNFVPEYPLSIYWPNVKEGIEIRFSTLWDGLWHIRFTGRTAAFNPSWPHGDLSDAKQKGDARVTLVASGYMRELIQDKAVRSAPHRTILPTSPVAYWTMEDGPDASAFSSALSGGHAMPVTAMAEAGAAGPGSWIPAMAALIIEPDTTGTMRAPIDGAQQTGEIAFGLAYQRIDGAETFFAAIIETSNGIRWRLYVDDVFNEIVVQGLDSSGPIGGVGGWTATLVDGNLHHILATVDQTGGDATIAVYVDGAPLSLSGSTISAVAVAPPIVAELDWLPGTPPPTQQPGELRIGHLAVWDTLPSAPTLNSGMQGWPGEQAHVRALRVGAESDIAISAIGTASEPMGRQQPGTTHQVLTAAADVDMALLYEARDSLSLVFRCRETLYLQTAALSLNAALSHIANPLRPVLDDLGVRNDITVARIDGGERRAVIADGPRSVKPPPDGVGPRPDRPVLNLNTDEQAGQQAGFRVAGASWPGMRYPRISPAIDAVPEIASEWLAADIGDLVVVTKLPPQHPRAAVEVLMMGYVETIEPQSWKPVINAASAGLYQQIGVYGPSNVASRYDTDASTLVVSVGAATTTLSVATTAGHALWRTGVAPSAPFPVDIEVSGIRLTVTAISGAASPQTFTVQRNVDGIDKPLPAGAKVRLWKPARYAL